MATVEDGRDAAVTGDDVLTKRTSSVSSNRDQAQAGAWFLRAIGSSRIRAGLAAYLVAIAFGVGYFLTRAMARHEPQWVAVAIAIAVAVPLVIGFVGYRISSIKTPFLEVSLSAAAVPTSANIPTDELNTLSATGVLDLSQQLRQLITAPGSQLLELDLRNGDHWWPTRLFLLSALLRDYTDVRRLVFVHGSRREYVGMAVPAAVCRRIEVHTPGLSTAYAAAREAAVSAAIGGETGPRSLQAARPGVPAVPLAGRQVDDARIVEWTVRQWPEAVTMYSSLIEVQHPERVGKSWLTHALGEDLHWVALQISGELAGALTQYRILVMEQDFVALLTDGQLSRVVGRCRLASMLATSYLEGQMAGRAP